jgi:hypothetical protein
MTSSTENPSLGRNRPGRSASTIGQGAAPFLLCEPPAHNKMAEGRARAERCPCVAPFASWPCRWRRDRESLDAAPRDRARQESACCAIRQASRRSVEADRISIDRNTPRAPGFCHARLSDSLNRQGYSGSARRRAILRRTPLDQDGRRAEWDAPSRVLTRLVR